MPEKQPAIPLGQHRVSWGVEDVPALEVVVVEVDEVVTESAVPEVVAVVVLLVVVESTVAVSVVGLLQAANETAAIARAIIFFITSFFKLYKSGKESSNMMIFSYLSSPFYLEAY